MTGSVSLKVSIEIPEGDSDLIDRLKLKGQFGIGETHFMNPVVQRKIDTLSRKGQGQPNNRGINSVASEMKGDFRLNDAVMDFSNLNFDVMGASVNLDGTYTLDSGRLNFHGTLMLRAKPSQTTTGVKSFFLRAVDPFFKGKNAGTVLAIKITVTKDNPKFGHARGISSKSDL